MGVLAAIFAGVGQEQAPAAILYSGNSTILRWPMLNCEAQVMLSSAELKKDSFLHDPQEKLGKLLEFLVP
nr:unnamed protein product [Callosobruchus analis]